MARIARSLTARIITQNTTERIPSTNGFDTSQRVASKAFHQTFMYPAMVLNRTRWQINRRPFHASQLRLSAIKES